MKFKNASSSDDSSPLVPCSSFISSTDTVSITDWPLCKMTKSSANASTSSIWCVAKTTLFRESDFVKSAINFQAKRFDTGSIDAVGSSRIAIDEFKSDNKSDTFRFCPPESVEICSSSLFEMASLDASS